MSFDSVAPMCCGIYELPLACSSHGRRILHTVAEVSLDLSASRQINRDSATRAPRNECTCAYGWVADKKNRTRFPTACISAARKRGAEVPVPALGAFAQRVIDLSSTNQELICPPVKALTFCSAAAARKSMAAGLAALKAALTSSEQFFAARQRLRIDVGSSLAQCPRSAMAKALCRAAPISKLIPAWRNQVARRVFTAEVAGSNPAVGLGFDPISTSSGVGSSGDRSGVTAVSAAGDTLTRMIGKAARNRANAYLTSSMPATAGVAAGLDVDSLSPSRTPSGCPRPVVSRPLSIGGV